MASTYTPEDALLYVKQMTKNMPVERFRVQALDQPSKQMWMAAPWRWTIGAMSPVQLTSNTQDYIITLPSNFLYLYDAALQSATDIPRFLDIEPAIPGDFKLVGNISCISIENDGTNDLLRTSPKSGSLSSDPIYIVSRYKKTAPIITERTSYNPVLVFPDEWFWVYCAGVLYYSYLYADDQRAGGAQVDANGKMQFTGQRAIFEAGIQQMREREKLPVAWVKPLPDQKGTK